MLVVCCDGTNNSFGHTVRTVRGAGRDELTPGTQNTNIVRLVELLKKDDPNQLVYYQVGILRAKHLRT